MKNLILLFLSFSLFACGSNDAPADTPGTGDFSAYTLQDIPGSEIKMAIKKDENGSLKEEGFVLNNQKTGTWVTYFPDLKVKSVTSYVNGQKNGLDVKMSDRGQVEFQSPFLNGQLHGRKVKYGFNRKIAEESNYSHGQMDGVFKSFDKQGVITREINYKAGKLDGANIFYSEGKKSMEYVYKDGEKISGGIVK